MQGKGGGGALMRPGGLQVLKTFRILPFVSSAAMVMALTAFQLMFEQFVRARVRNK
jgi:hypothetical protein